KAPQGEFFSPQKAFERFSSLKKLELQREKAEVLRISVKNYTETKKLLPYLRGKFEVMETRALTSKDLFPMGTVALLQAQDYPQVVVEHVFPATGQNIEAGMRLLHPGFQLSIEKTSDVSTILRAERLADGRMLFTVVPLHYPSYAPKVGAGTFSTEPPADLVVEAGLPIWKRDQLNDALTRFAQLKATAPPALEGNKTAATAPELVRVDTVPIGQEAPEKGTIPEPTVAAAQPVRPNVPVRPSVRVAPTPVLSAPPPRPRTDLLMDSSREPP